jgi:SAM-dependent methyltransferase
MFRDVARKIPWLRNAYVLCLLFTREFAWSHFANIFWYGSNYFEIKRTGNPNFGEVKLLPCLSDKTRMTPMDPVYFFQDTWAAKKIFELNPTHHYDVGSSAKTMGILSQYVPVTMIDIRPLPVSLPGFNFIEGSILKLPFEDGSIESLSSLCVVEHIGLGRYGDAIDAFGSEKAIKEIQRVVKAGGTIVMSLPVDTNNTVYFNAHRAFTREYVLHLFDGFEVVEERYQYGYQMVESYSPASGFGTGLFLFRKPVGVA